MAASTQDPGFTEGLIYPRKTATVLAWVMPHLIAHVTEAGHDASPLRLLPGLRGRDLTDPDVRVPASAAIAAWRLAQLTTGDEAIGLHMAQAIPKGALDLLEYAFRASATLGSALEQLVRYFRVANDGTTIRKMLRQTPTPDDSTATQVRRQLLDSLGRGEAASAAIGRTLAVSERTLHRRLRGRAHVVPEDPRQRPRRDGDGAAPRGGGRDRGDRVPPRLFRTGGVPPIVPAMDRTDAAGLSPRDAAGVREKLEVRSPGPTSGTRRGPGPPRSSIGSVPPTAAA